MAVVHSQHTVVSMLSSFMFSRSNSSSVSRSSSPLLSFPAVTVVDSEAGGGGAGDGDLAGGGSMTSVTRDGECLSRTVLLDTIGGFGDDV